MSDPLQQYPFTRVWVDRLVIGKTRIWWRLHENFQPNGSLVYRLQAGNTGSNTSQDWEDVGSPVTNAAVLVDDVVRMQTKKSRLHYRIVLTNNGKTYVSLPVGTWGLFDDAGWAKVVEILRLHEINHRLSTRHGLLLKKMRYGRVDQNAINPLTGAPIDSRRSQTFGTEFEIGYHPPVACTCMDLTPQVIAEDISDAGPKRDQAVVTGLTAAFPQPDFEDVWVDIRSDQRWQVQTIRNEIEFQGVPIVISVTMTLLPENHIAYRIPVDAQSAVPSILTQTGPTGLTNPVVIDHNYGGADALTYVDPAGCGVIGATLLLFRKVDYDNGLRGAASAIAIGQTGAAGRWMNKFRIDPGQYVLVAEKLGEFGPNHIDITVTAP